MTDPQTPPPMPDMQSIVTKNWKLFLAEGIVLVLLGIGAIVVPPIAGLAITLLLGWLFLIGGVFYIGFGSSRSFILALLFLLIAHTGGSILWVFSTVLLQREVEDQFRGRVFAAELALLTLTMAASNFLVGELMDRFGFSPRVVTVGVGTFFVLPGLLWLLTEKWWNRKDRIAELPPTSTQSGLEDVSLPG